MQIRRFVRYQFGEKSKRPRIQHSTMPDLKYPRVLIKLSGEAFAGEKGFGFDFDTVSRLADEVVSVMATGASVGVVIGGGNIVRGSCFRKPAWTASPPTTWACSAR